MLRAMVLSMGLILLASCASAEDKPELNLKTFALWIHANTGLPMPKDYPVVVGMPHDAMCRNYTQDPDMLKECLNPDAPLTLMAFYRGDLKLIGVPNTFNPNDLYDLSFIIHELTHHMQYEAGVDKPLACHKQLEPQAYKAQADWLAAQGDPHPWKTMDIDRMTLKLVSMCPGET